MKWKACAQSDELTSDEWVEWDRLIAENGGGFVHLDSRCVQALLMSEERRARAIRWFGESGDLLGLAVVEEAHAESHNLAGHLQSDNWLFSTAYRWLHGADGVLRFPVRVMGALLGSGEPGYCFATGVPDDEAKAHAAEALKALPVIDGFVPRAHLIKDFRVGFEAERVAGGQSWLSGWTDLEFDPYMRVPVNPAWKDLSDYMAELKTKSRTKVKRILSCSDDCEIQELTLSEVIERAHELERLYREVYDEAGFRLGTLRAQDLVETKKSWGHEFRVCTLVLKGEVLGFQCGFLTTQKVEAFFVGFDRGRHKELMLYQRMLLEFIRWGIEMGAQEVAMGRTALDIKSFVGALPERLACVVRFRNPMLNILARLAARWSQPMLGPIKRPWRQDAFAMQLDSSEVHSAIHSATKISSTT